MFSCEKAITRRAAPDLRARANVDNEAQLRPSLSEARQPEAVLPLARLTPATSCLETVSPMANDNHCGKQALIGIQLQRRNVVSRPLRCADGFASTGTNQGPERLPLRTLLRRSQTE
ncbi:hypothetical protein [Mesorhizobium sp. M0093]|uniref:hypothetical protein n=1 Tax=unclassified Mesorhizobium TaxID=325217 RepID=UPI00333839BF